jgi:hypothetical protein
MDGYLMGQWTGLPADQIARLQVNSKGVPHCIFRIANSPG